jgi:hypothetical protein
LGRVVALGLPLLALHAALLVLGDLAGHLAASLAVLALAFVALVVAARHLPSSVPGLAGGTLLVAALLRLCLLPLPPSLSDDLLRYVWDGRVVAAGLNPYRLAPEAPELAPLRDELWQRMPHKEIPTVYPPLALGLFSIAARLPNPLIAWKTVLTAVDLLTCWGLFRLAGRLGLPPARVVWYAWNPLVVLEVAGMGHVDALGVAGVTGALLALGARPPRPVAAAAATAAGIFAKLGPLAAIPLWARRSGRPLPYLATVALLLAACGLPVLLAAGGVPPGLVAYGVDWEFNGPVYEPLWRLLDAVGAADGAARALDSFKEATQQWERWNWIYPFLYPQFLAKLLLAAGMLAAVVGSLEETRLVAGTGRLFANLLLLSATLYPWYLLWVLPWAALTLHPAWLALSALVLLSYIPQGSPVELFPGIFLAIWLPFWALWAFSRRWSTV